MHFKPNMQFLNDQKILRAEFDELLKFMNFSQRKQIIHILIDQPF